MSSSATYQQLESVNQKNNGARRTGRQHHDDVELGQEAHAVGDELAGADFVLIDEQHAVCVAVDFRHDWLLRVWISKVLWWLVVRYSR